MNWINFNCRHCNSKYMLQFDEVEKFTRYRCDFIKSECPHCHKFNTHPVIAIRHEFKFIETLIPLYRHYLILPICPSNNSSDSL